MNCPVCGRSLDANLSICFTCGAMRNDSVREELQPKVTSVAAASRPDISSPPAADTTRGGAAPPASFDRPRPTIKPDQPRTAPAAALRASQMPRSAAAAAPARARRDTVDLITPKTSPTLVGFHPKTASVPEWRLQMQNAVQQRKGAQKPVADPAKETISFPAGNAKPPSIDKVETALAGAKADIADPRVAAAMRRIEESRKTFQGIEAQGIKAGPATPVTNAPARPFEVVMPNANAGPAIAPTRTVPQRPRLVASPPPVEKRDTNKLPPIETVIIDKPAEKRNEETPSVEAVEINRIRIRAEAPEVSVETRVDDLTDEIEDLAPFSMRFSAGLFDLIIGGFASFLLLSPLAFATADWFTTASLLTVAGTFAVFMFLYMTICLGFFGKTMGMRLFSLELVDAVENEYPTLQQAAVNSCIFLVSLAFAGAGFLTVFFNEERRALHDLLSGTILVREF